MQIAGLIFSFILLFFLAHPTFAQETPKSFLIINQIRGAESCCQPGSTDFIPVLESDDTIKDLVKSYAFRFDALANTSFIEPVKNVGRDRLGVLLEITPKLALASGVKYKGERDGSDWYHGRNVFLIGYTQIERKQLIDTVMKAFQERFGTYPTFTVGWMIDAWSLEYLYKEYGVLVHEITKEQFETDHYTLYGGPFNLPYFASVRHPLVPQSEKRIMLTRQTISDVAKNYGSAHAYFTSQPNDYLKNPEKQTTNYFQRLVSENDFGVIGLENSKEWAEFAEEYKKQLQLMSQSQRNGSLVTQTPKQYYLEHEEETAKSPKLLKTPDFPRSGQSWFFGNQYRALLEIWNGDLILTDYRVYPTSLSDPYLTKPAAVSQAYWTLPYLLDSSQQFLEMTKDEKRAGEVVRTDSGVERLGIKLMSGPIKEVVQMEEGIEIKTATTSGIRLTENGIELAVLDEVEFLSPVNKKVSELLSQKQPLLVSFSRHPRFFMAPINNALVMGWEGDDQKPVAMAQFVQRENKWHLIPNLSLKVADLENMSAIFQPDQAPQQFSFSQSTFYFHNTQAIAGRNPIRVFIVPRNNLGRMVTLSDFSLTASNQNIQVTVPNNVQYLHEPFFAEITATEAESSDLTFQINHTILPLKQRVEFVEDCKKDFKTCLKNPQQLQAYLKLLVAEKLSQITYQ